MTRGVPGFNTPQDTGIVVDAPEGAVIPMERVADGFHDLGRSFGERVAGSEGVSEKG